MDPISLRIDSAVVSGITPESLSNAGAYGLSVSLAQDYPFITTRYDGSVVSTFDFSSFYFSCAAGNVKTMAPAPLACSTTVGGYKDGDEVGSQSFSFAPAEPSSSPMMQASVGEWCKGVHTVKFETRYTLGLDVKVSATLLDNLSYTVYVS